MRKLLLFIFFGVALGVYAQERSVSGVVTDGSGTPIPGVSVVEKGTSNGMMTANDGRYAIKVKSSESIIEFTFIGMKRVEEKASSSTINVVMEDDFEALDEVIVVAYGTTKKTTFTGSASQIRGEELNNTPVASVADAMTGLASGLQVSPGSGQPGSVSSIRIRGTGSINSSNEPLYVIDGVPTQNDNITALSTSTNLSSLSSLNPNDIQSVTVLKDAAAASLYGSRAANGVIIITTKKGAEGKTKFSVNLEAGYSDFAVNTLELASPEEAFDYKVMGYKNYLTEYRGFTDSEAQAKAVSDIGEYFGKYDPTRANSDYDWKDALFRTGQTQNVQFSASGGNSKTKFFASLGYLSMEGLAVGSDYERVSGRLNLDHRASELLSFGSNISFAKITQNVIPSNGYYFINPMYATNTYLNQLTPIRNLDGLYNEAIQGGTRPNLVQENGLNYSVNEVWTTDFQAYVQLDLLENLVFRSTNSFNIQTTYGSKYWSPLSQDGASFDGYSYENNKRRTKLATSNVLTYNKSFGEEHQLDALLGYEAEDLQDRLLYAEGSNFPNDIASSLDVAAKPLSVYLNEKGDRLQSIFSRLNYNYDNKYYLSVSYRTDASSRLGVDNRWGSFYSISGSWRISSESWMKNIEFVNDLKLRASYGTNGTLPTSWVGSLGLYAYGHDYNNIPGMNYDQIENKDLGWEKNNTLDIAVEAKLFDFLSIELDFYNRKTKDLLLLVPTSRTTGFSSYWANVGEMTNKGFELSIATDNIRKEDFSWTTRLLLSKNKNTIDKLEGGDNVATFPFILREGESYNSIYLRDWAGVNPENGHAQWYVLEDEKRVDKDGDGKYDVTENSSAADKKIVGDGTPDLIGSLGNTLKYKNIDFSFLFYFQLGGDAYISPYNSVFDDGADLNKAVTKAQLENYWTTPGESAALPKVVYGAPQNSHYNSSRRVVDGSYLRLQSINLGYNLPRAWSQKIKINNVRLYASASNLWTLSKIDHFDPAGDARGVILSDFDFPPTKSLTFGLQLKF